MSPEFIFFDLDNTILDHSSAEHNAQISIYEQYPELQEVSIDEWLDKYKQVNHRLWQKYQKGEVDRYTLQRSRFKDSMIQLGISDDRSEEIGSTYMQVYRTYWRWIDGAEEALIDVAGRYPVGFMTNGFQETQQSKIEFLDLKRFSDLFVISEEVGVMKPHPKVFDVATERSSVEREQIVYVGDSYSSDIVGGQNAGWKTAWYTAFVEHIEEHQTADFCFEQFPVLVDFLQNEK